MPPSLAAENSPLLAQAHKQVNYNGDIAIEDDETGTISVVSTSPAKSVDQHDDLLKKRLNGSPLMVVLVG